jgi:hypothetical protein
MRRAWLLTLWLLTLAIAFGLGTARRTPDGAERPDEAEMRDGVSQALSDRDYLRRTGQLVRLLEGLDRGNLIGALDAYEARLDTTGEPEIRLFLHAWARIDPAVALEHVQTWPRAKQVPAVAAVTLTWARTDPRRAAAAVARAETRVADTAAPSIVQGWALSGEPGVETWIAQRPHGPERTRLVASVIAERLRAGRADDVIAWAESVPPRTHDGLKRIVFRRVANQLGAEDPERTAAWLEPHLGQPYARASMRELMRQWLPADPEAAFAWIAARPADEERGDAIESAVTTWMRRDPERAEAWLGAVARNPLHDPALVAIADELVREDPRRALAWAERIQDEALRVSTLARVGTMWARRAPDEARTWLRTSSLSPETRRELRAAMGIRPPNPQTVRGEQIPTP